MLFNFWNITRLSSISYQDISEPSVLRVVTICIQPPMLVRCLSSEPDDPLAKINSDDEYSPTTTRRGAEWLLTRTVQVPEHSSLIDYFHVYALIRDNSARPFTCTDAHQTQRHARFACEKWKAGRQKYPPRYRNSSLPFTRAQKTIRKNTRPTNRNYFERKIMQFTARHSLRSWRFDSLAHQSETI